ncbi:protein L [uncultured Cedecea sp.]|uniref:protein L n=1 Tax=uncultured Cedecea sp. TaxID=988762 RepID=UPI00261AF494|nr:protein L [uncultured Cedecea sp.]
MALVRSGNKQKILEAGSQFNPVFDTEYKPGDTCKYEGIYKCTGCDKEVTIANGKTIPPQNHHQHSVSQGNIRWKLFVYAQ